MRTWDIRRVRSKCWPELGECPEPIAIYRSGGSDMQTNFYERHTEETNVCRPPGSGSGQGSRYPSQKQQIAWKYAQQTRTENTFGEDEGNMGAAGKERAESTLGMEEKKLIQRNSFVYICGSQFGHGNSQNPTNVHSSNTD